MNDVESINEFKFTLTQGDVKLFERTFDGNQFSLHTRSYIDIRKILPSSINQLQKVLSKNGYNTKISVDSDSTTADGKLIKGKYYNLFGEYIKNIDSFPISLRKELEYNPEPVSFKVNANTSRGTESMTIRGVECKIVLYRNDIPIVERLFYVDRFNPVARWSLDLTNTCDYIVDDIFNIITRIDSAYLWSEYDKLVETSDVLIID